MAINFKLGERQSADRSVLNRDWYGWSDSASDQKIYDNNRGIWLLGPRADRERWATFSYDGRIRVAVEIAGIDVVPSDDPVRPRKRAIRGRVLKPSDPMYDSFVGKPAPDSHRNPVTYCADPDSRPRVCACGCGAPVSGERAFHSGHDQRAVHQRIAKRWGDTLGFIAWFDATEGESSA